MPIYCGVAVSASISEVPGSIALMNLDGQKNNLTTPKSRVCHERWQSWNRPIKKIGLRRQVKWKKLSMLVKLNWAQLLGDWCCQSYFIYFSVRDLRNLIRITFPYMYPRIPLHILESRKLIIKHSKLSLEWVWWWE